MDRAPQYSWAAITCGAGVFFAMYVLIWAAMRATLRHVAMGGHDALEERVEQYVHRVRTINGPHRARR